MFITAGIQFKHGKKSFVCGLPTSLFVALLRFRKTVNGPFGRNFGVTLGPPLGLSAFQADELAGERRNPEHFGTQHRLCLPCRRT